MKSQLGERIQELGKKQHLSLRQVAPLLEIDTLQLNRDRKRRHLVKSNYKNKKADRLYSKNIKFAP